MDQFIINNHTQIHFWWKKICEHDYLQNFLLLFMSLLTALMLKQSYFGWNFLYLSEITSWTKLERWWKVWNLLNHQKISKYCEHDCPQNFLLLFMSLLTDLIVKNSQILAGIYFIFLRLHPRPWRCLDQTWKTFNTKFGPQ